MASASASIVLEGGPVRTSFSVAFATLFAYTIVTGIEALTSRDAATRHVMNIETVVSVVASLFYAAFVRMAGEPGFEPARTIPYRYLDWSLTTPCLLLSLMLFLQGGPVPYATFLGAVALDYAMLGFGYLGETGRMGRGAAGALGFACFAALALLLWAAFGARARSSAVKAAMLGFFVLLWALYGVAYFLPDEGHKAVAYNALDVLSKAVFGLYLWAIMGRVLAA